MILAIDQGTTGTTCLVFDTDGELAGRAYREFEQHFPQPGWVEHDAAEIWAVTEAVAADALDDAGAGELHAIGITNQRETVCVWDPSTGEPLHRALVWQDRRTAERCDELREAGHEPLIRERTGLELDAPISGQRALRGAVLPVVVPFAPRFGMEIGMTVDAARAGFRVGEVELDLAHRSTGKDWRGFVHRARQLKDFVLVEFSRR